MKPQLFRFFRPGHARPLTFAALLLVLAALTACTGCQSDASRAINVFEGRDRIPPRLTDLRAVSATEVQAVFDEPVTISVNDSPYSCTSSANTVTFSLGFVLDAGRSVEIRATVRDEWSNSTSFSGTVFGYNPDVPALLITELTTTGSAKSPDCTELYCLTDGNLCGVCLYDGLPDEYNFRFVFPSASVRKGDYIVIEWEGKGNSTVGNVHFFGAGLDTNPSQYNGLQALSVSPSPGADVMDCVLYANHAGVAYERFGSAKNLRRATKAVERGLWRAGGEITGLCAVDASKTSATRSIARIWPYQDTDTAYDWYITATGGCTFGAANTAPAFDYQ